ncbi:hypothetical protein DFH08DRAFT_826537 [Mycena albidolilacea]|uniref:Uncharacterized protein n=1 Tax=Mycena albidolilacea TaxID=1033008 RepID=A0AAD6YZW2_9AGAR|nr:hypothetical protein DFH08DRAFT_826537 [Mycena albidolilacea]
MTIVEAAAYTSTCLPLDGGAPGLDEPRRWRDSSISESWFVELCLAASSHLVMDGTSRLDAARHGLRLGASEASRNAAVYQWAEHSESIQMSSASNSQAVGIFATGFRWNPASAGGFHWRTSARQCMPPSVNADHGRSAGATSVHITGLPRITRELMPPPAALCTGGPQWLCQKQQFTVQVKKCGGISNTFRYWSQGALVSVDKQ